MVSSHIVIKAVNNDGTPVTGKKIVFQAGNYGYLDNNQISDTRETNDSGVAEINFYIPKNAGISMTETVYVIATLIDEGRADSSITQVNSIIPIEIIPYANMGFLLTGHVTTPLGVGISEVVVELKGEDGHASGAAVTQSDGEYRFYVNSGWYGEIAPPGSGGEETTPDLGLGNIAAVINYTFTPASYTFEAEMPVLTNIYNLNFIGISDEKASKLSADISTWAAPMDGGSQLVNVYNISKEKQIDYFVIPDSNWLRVSPSSGSTPGSFDIIADANNTSATRTGKVMISATNTQSTEVTITVNQIVNDNTSYLAVSPTDIYVPASGNVRYIVTVSNPTTSDVLNWTLDSDATWLGITPTSGDTDNNNTFEVKVQGANPTSTDRVGRIYITAKFNNADVVAVVKVRQVGS
jgi:hypothetical protein